MFYNWQQSDWGKFSNSINEIEDELFLFTEKVGKLKGLLETLPENSKEETLIELLVSEAIKTSEIENEYLSRKDVTSSIRLNLGLYEPKDIKDLKSKQVGKLITIVRKTYNEPLSENVLKNWHKYLFPNNTQINVGKWRKHKEPMQVVSGAIGREKIHFEAPPSKEIPQQIKTFIKWFNNTAPNGKNTIKYAPIRAAISHLYFESIHPFEDGNGRIGRAIADKALSQSLQYPLLLSLSIIIEKNKNEYYKALENAQKSNKINSWLKYFINVIIDAQNHTEVLIDFTLKKSRFFDLFSDKINNRQLKCIQRIFKEGIKGFDGGITAKKYMKITKSSKATATRDLKSLTEMGAFVIKGKGRNTHYFIKMD